MKIRAHLLALAPLVVFNAVSARDAQGPCLLKSGDVVAIVGDSITEQKLYSKFIETYLLASSEVSDVTCYQLGWGGETAIAFLNRMDNDLMTLKPGVVTLCYGMNDGHYVAYDESIGKGYREPLTKVVTKLKDAGARVVVGSPGAVDTTTFGRVGPAIYNDNLGHLRDIAHQIADASGMRFANVHDTMMASMASAKAALGPAYAVAGGDGVHPGENGHLLMAEAFLNGLGCAGEIAKIEVSMAGPAKASAGHQVVSATPGHVKLKSIRYPFCFHGAEKDPGGTVSILPFSKFNDELNHFTLIVTGLTSAKADVQWGKGKKTFTKQQLETGVNLAAEFIDNPFVPAFDKLMAAVANKQNFETLMIKNTLNPLRRLPSQIPGDKVIEGAVNTIADRLGAKEAEQQKSVHATKVPVEHEIIITAVK
ncbi:MAG: GDSL-like Lipase/Acylhydrolase [Verrucomicrobiaceae bacterium]|nr:GDSL-like Lipase/Acylhydrolase [Verrucomicrobiaceae bacterium]